MVPATAIWKVWSSDQSTGSSRSTEGGNIWLHQAAQRRNAARQLVGRDAAGGEARDHEGDDGEAQHEGEGRGRVSRGGRA